MGINIQILQQLDMLRNILLCVTGRVVRICSIFKNPSQNMTEYLGAP